MGLLVGSDFPPPGTFTKKGGSPMKELIKSEWSVLLAIVAVVILFFLA